MKKIIITLLCLAIVGGGGFFGYKKYKQVQDDKRIVDVVPVSMMCGEYSYYFYYMDNSSTMGGTVVSSNTQSIGLNSQNEVKKVYVKVGDTVKEGDLLMEYDTTLLNLQIAQKEAGINVKKQELAKAQKELNRIRNLRPYEERPAYVVPQPEEPQEPEDSDDPGMQFVEYTEDLEDFSSATGVDENGALCFNVSLDCIVHTSFMEQLRGSHRSANIRVHNGSQLLYLWQLDADDENITVHEWQVSNGVTVGDGVVSYDGSANGECGQFFVYTGPADNDEPDDYDFGEDPDFYDDGDSYDFDDGSDSEEFDENYTHTRSELSKMVIDQERTIKNLEFEIRTAELEYKEESKKAKDGKVYAKIDGIVTKIGDEKLEDSMYDSDEEEEDYDEDEYSDGMDEMSFGEDGGFGFDEGSGSSKKSSSYMIIHNNDTTELKIEVYELDLGVIKPGTVLTGTSFETGDVIEAEVDSIDPEPIRYNYDGWGDINPNNSTYSVVAHVIGDSELPIDSYIEMQMQQDDPMIQNTDSLYLPVWYVHKEGARSYVMKKGKDGLLKKQYVETGSTLYDEIVEIKKGVTEDDMICFPYGKDVKEGVKTKESDKILSIYGDDGGLG